MAIILNLVDESEAGRWICSPLPLHLILFLEPSIKKSQVNAVFIQQTMRVAQADQELIIKQRISILGCQIWSGFVFFGGNGGNSPKPFFETWVVHGFTMFLISCPNIREGPAQMFGWVETPKPSPRPQG